MIPAYAAAVEALHLRFVTEVIEAGDFCPWARGARLQGRVAIDVCTVVDLEVRVRHWLTDPAVEVVQLVVPDLPDAALRWRERVALLERALRADGVTVPFAFAAFHPQHPGRPESVGGAIGLLRRSPFPMVQLIRLSVLDAVRAQHAEAADGLTERNYGRVRAEWVERWEQVVRELIDEGIELRASDLPFKLDEHTR